MVVMFPMFKIVIVLMDYKANVKNKKNSTVTMMKIPMFVNNYNLHVLIILTVLNVIPIILIVKLFQVVLIILLVIYV